MHRLPPVPSLLCKARPNRKLTQFLFRPPPSPPPPLLLRQVRRLQLDSFKPDPALPLIKLRDYQEECVQAVISHLEKGYRRMGISLATGSGKTVIFTELISRLAHPSRPSAATQTLVLAHRIELVQQAYRQCRRTYPDATIEIEMGAEHASGVADITVASLASLMSGDRLARYNPHRFKMLLIDECHHAVSARYLRALDHFGVLNMDVGPAEEKPLVIGVSATMSRFDGLRLGKVLDYVVYHKDYTDLISQKWLSPVAFTTVKSRADLSKVRSTKTGDFQVGELEKAVNTEVINDITVRSWIEKAGDRKSTIAFCVNLAHVDAMVAKFRHYGIDAHSITNRSPLRQRAATLESFKRREFPVLVNCGIFTEGTDIPNVDCVLLARPTRSRNLLVQMIGRGMRLHPEKENCLVIDMVGSIENGIVTLPTLLGLDPDEMLENMPVEAGKQQSLMKESEDSNDHSYSNDRDYLNNGDRPDDLGLGDSANAGKSPSNLVVSFTDYDSVYDLIAEGGDDPHIRQLTRLAWVRVRDNPLRYILQVGKSATLSLVADYEGTYSVTVTHVLPKEANPNGYLKARPRTLIDRAERLDDAVHGADTFALNRYPRVLLERNAPWRERPATPGQLNLLKKICGSRELDINMGRASDMITQLKHGAMARLREMKAQKKRLLRQREKQENLRKRERVTVGELPA